MNFARSNELKNLFNTHFERWKYENRAGLEELANRCGVTSSYLAHVGRYGRIPGNPVLLLLALNFGMKDPAELLRAARVSESWPYERGIRLSTAAAQDDGLLSIKLDMDGFTAAIRSVVRAETRPRAIQDLTRGRPLRVGYNHLQDWLFDDVDLNHARQAKGFFPDFCEMLAVSLQCEVEPSFVNFPEFTQRFQEDTLDLFGPIVWVPTMRSEALFTRPLYKLGLSGLMRKVKTSSLETLPAPRSIEDLLQQPYKIAVVKNSRAHLFANTRLKLNDDALVLCATHVESLERLLMSNIPNPAHLSFCNSVTAIRYHKQHAKQLQLLFATSDSVLNMSEDAIAIRPDWPELLPVINQAIQYLIDSKSLSSRFTQWISPELAGVVEVM